MRAPNTVRHAESAAELLTVMGNSKRLAIITYLLEEELSVGAIAQRVKLSQSALSQHLARLRSLGLVETRRDRQMIYYSCRSEPVRMLMETLDRIFEPA
jgi:DNA-binding transcriptional ArsR family regulator